MLYIHYILTPEVQSSSVLPYDQWFPRYRTFYHSSLTTILNGQIKKKMSKILNFKFHYCFNNFGRNPPQEYAWIWVANLVGSFRGDVVWNVYSHVSENKNKLSKIQNLKFHNCLNNFGRDPPLWQAELYLPPLFHLSEINFLSKNQFHWSKIQF